MFEFLDRAGGAGYGTAIFWVLAALVLFAVVLLIVKTIRSMNFGTFVAGGRNRKTRLAVMDATAVDSHRRLVLVRRDDVEHLILIGGPTDVVVERDIRLAASRRAAAPLSEPAPVPHQPSRAPVPAPPRAAPPQAPVSAPARPAPIAPQPPAARHVEPVPPPVADPSPRANIPVQPRQPVQSVDDALDDSLASELALSLDDPAPARSGPSLDDEMSRLLGELSTGKR